MPNPAQCEAQQGRPPRLAAVLTQLALLGVLAALAQPPREAALELE